MVVFAVLTVGRNRVWHDELSLWSDTALKTPGLARVRSSLGLALYRQGKIDLARAEFVEARHNPARARASTVRAPDGAEGTAPRRTP